MPFIIYTVYKSILKPATDNNKDGTNTEKYQDHIVCSYSYKLIYVDKQFSRSHKSYF